MLWALTAIAAALLLCWARRRRSPPMPPPMSDGWRRDHEERDGKAWE